MHRIEHANLAKICTYLHYKFKYAGLMVHISDADAFILKIILNMRNI